MRTFTLSISTSRADCSRPAIFFEGFEITITGGKKAIARRAFRALKPYLSTAASFGKDSVEAEEAKKELNKKLAFDYQAYETAKDIFKWIRKPFNEAAAAGEKINFIFNLGE